MGHVERPGSVGSAHAAQGGAADAVAACTREAEQRAAHAPAPVVARTAGAVKVVRFYCRRCRSSLSRWGVSRDPLIVRALGAQDGAQATTKVRFEPHHSARAVKVSAPKLEVAERSTKQTDASDASYSGVGRCVLLMGD